jgi:hypothetical protein
VDDNFRKRVTTAISDFKRVIESDSHQHGSNSSSNRLMPSDE